MVSYFTKFIKICNVFSKISFLKSWFVTTEGISIQTVPTGIDQRAVLRSVDGCDYTL